MQLSAGPGHAPFISHTRENTERQIVTPGAGLQPASSQMWRGKGAEQKPHLSAP